MDTKLKKQKYKKPHIMFYRCTRPPSDITKLDVESFNKINDFFKNFETGGATLGLYKTYDHPEQFERLVHYHIQQYLLMEYGDILVKNIELEESKFHSQIIINNS